MRKAWDEKFITELLESKDHVEFITLFFNVSSFERTHPKPISFQRFSDLAGYSSKSYPADIIAGRKQLKIDSIDKFSKGLSLNQLYSAYLKNLILINSPSNEINQEEKENCIAKNKKIKSKILNDLKVKISQVHPSYSTFEKLLLQENFPEIFASLGSEEKGASVGEVVKRSNIAPEVVQPIMDQMKSEGLLTKEHDRYYLIQSAFDFEFLKMEEYFRRDFYRSIEKAKKRFDHQSTSDSSLFTVQTFSIDSERLPELKKRLLQTVLEFSSQYEHPEGNRVAEILVSLSHC